MTAPDVQQTSSVEQRHPGLAARLIGVIFSPRATYTAVVARPRVLGAFLVTIAIGCACQFAFLSTEVGQDALFDRQLEAMENFGVEVTPQMVTQMESRLATAPYTTVAAQAIATPIVAAILAGLLLVGCNAMLDGNATFKQAYALVAHGGVIVTLQQLFSAPINYARGDMASPASLSVFAPMLDPDGIVGGFLGAVDLFFIWWLVSLAIGLGALYTRRTGPFATTLLCVYASIALVVAVFF